MLDSSQDILNIIKAIGIFAVTATLAWFLYYLAMIMRQIFCAIKEMRERVKKVDRIITNISGTLGEGATGIMHIMEGAKLVIDSFNEQSKKFKAKAKK